MQNPTALLSPSIIKLTHDFNVYGIKVIDELKASLATKELPLIEKSDSDDTCLVTFIWWGNEDLTHVWFYSELNPSQVPLPMHKIQNAEIFYLTLEVANDIRFAYAFLPNVEFELKEDPKARIEELGKLMPRFQPDPYNPNKHLVGGTTILFSIAEMPKASQVFAGFKTKIKPEGQLKKITIKSEILNQERDVYIYTPYGYEKLSECDLMLLFDGLMYMDDAMNLPLMLDHLIAENKINPTIAVFVDSLGIEQRNRDLMCSNNFTNFLENELLPWIKMHYTLAGNERNVVTGASLGGMYALYFSIKNPQLFSNVLMNSAAFWCDVEKLNAQLDSCDKLQLKIYMDYGSLEDADLMKKLNQQYANKLSCLGAKVKIQEFKGGHNYYSWRETIGNGLEFLIGKESG